MMLDLDRIVRAHHELGNAITAYHMARMSFPGSLRVSVAEQKVRDRIAAMSDAADAEPDPAKVIRPLFGSRPDGDRPGAA